MANPYDPISSLISPESETEYSGPSYLMTGANHPSQVPAHIAQNAAQPSNAGDIQRFNPPPQPDFESLGNAIRAQQSPYISMGAHGWLQNNHPEVAGRLDSALAAMASTTSGRTAAENIAGFARGVVGGRQMEQQHAIEQATLPLTLAHQQMAYQAGLMGLYKSGAEINRDNAMASYYGQHGNYLMGRLGQLGDQYGSQAKIDDNGEPWLPGKNGQGMVYAGNNPAVNENYIPTFNKANQRGGAGGGLWSNIATAADQPGATPQQNASNRLNLYNQSQAANAGGKKAATDIAGEAEQNQQNFLKAEKDKVAASLGKRPTEADQKDFVTSYYLQHMNDSGFDPGKIPSLAQRQSDWDNKATTTKGALSRYERSNDWRKLREFNPGNYPDASQAPVAQAPQTTVPKGGGLDSALDQIFPRQ